MAMKLPSMFLRCGLLWIVLCASLTSTFTRSSQFEVKSNNLYAAFDSKSFLVNTSSRSIAKCAANCLDNSLCLTANYDAEWEVCSLFAECNLLGQQIPVGNVSLIVKNSPYSCRINASQGLLLYLNNPPASNYTFYSYLYVASASSASLTFAFIHQIDSWILDDVVVWNGTHNLLTNGGFETGNLQGWNYSYPSNLSAVADRGQVDNGTSSWNQYNKPHTGIYYYRDAVWDISSSLTQNFNTIRTRVYNVSFWLLSNALGNATYYARCNVTILP